MKRVSIDLVALGVVSLALTACAGSIKKTWDTFPEAYFLTSAEKDSWKQVKTDEEAQNFILDYKARRGPDFDKMLSERVAAADKYFSAGETKGSETLRGKVVIVFGPPSRMEKAKIRSGADGDANAGINEYGYGRANMAVGSGGKSPIGYATPHAQNPTVVFVYDKQAAPEAIGEAFKVELKMISSATQESWDENDLNAKFEAVARASIVAPESAPKPDKP